MSTTQDLRNRVGPILSDGTPLASLVDLEKREVALRTLADPEIHRLELSRIYARTWVGIAHLNEIPNPGDFVLRHIGEDPVIVTRDRDGEVHVLLNVCAHRGMEVCWADEGNQSQFKCPYHGWVFDNSGNLLGAPFEQEMYGDWDKSQYGLRRARVETRIGVIWACFGDAAPDLDEWLGDIGWYIDISENEDLVPLGPPTRTLVNANWKAAFDQLVGDGYHGVTTHKALYELGFQTGDVSNAKETGNDRIHISSELGHGIFFFPPMTNAQSGIDTTGQPDDYSFNDRILQIALFPQTQLSARARMTMPDGTVLRFGGLTHVIPRGPNHFELLSISLIGPDAPEELRAMVRRMNITTTALILADDVGSWPSMQRVANGVVGGEQPMRYPAIAGERKPDGWPGPGSVHTGFGKDDAQWKFWQRWFDLMTAED